MWLVARGEQYSGLYGCKAVLLVENSPVTRLREKPIALSPAERVSLSVIAA
jgi:hypothetical protein